MTEKTAKPGHDLMLRVRQAFLDYGYSELSMIGLAKACGFSRRALYNYFSSKEDAFRASIRHENAQNIRACLEAGERVRKSNGSAADIIAEIINMRYGYARRELHQSPHLAELNAEALRRCHDNMIDTAVEFQSKLESLLIQLEHDGLLQLKGDFCSKDVARLLADGGYAVNHTLPLIAFEDLSRRCHMMCRAILYGCATPPGGNSYPNQIDVANG